jgi:hypothetical protein
MAVPLKVATPSTYRAAWYSASDTYSRYRPAGARVGEGAGALVFRLGLVRLTRHGLLDLVGAFLDVLAYTSGRVGDRMARLLGLVADSIARRPGLGGDGVPGLLRLVRDLVPNSARAVGDGMSDGPGVFLDGGLGVGGFLALGVGNAARSQGESGSGGCWDEGCFPVTLRARRYEC